MAAWSTVYGGVVQRQGRQVGEENREHPSVQKVFSISTKFGI